MRYLEDLRIITLSFIYVNADFSKHMEYMGHMIYPGGLGVQKAKVEAIS
jgi:hypothetical protein